jgi:hypothetical protein
LKSLKKCETLQYVFYVGEPDEKEMKELEEALSKRAQKAVDIESRVLTFEKLTKIVQSRSPRKRSKSSGQVFCSPPELSMMLQGKYNASEVPEDPTPEDIALVMYTSGATGIPKVFSQLASEHVAIHFHIAHPRVPTLQGVLLSHANFVASVAGYAADLETSFDPSIDKYLA